jgi:hypothetical protein
MGTLSLRKAADLLEATPRLVQVRVATTTTVPAVFAWDVHDGEHHDSDNDNDGSGSGPNRRDAAQQMRRFNSALEKHRKVRAVSFVSCPFGVVRCRRSAAHQQDDLNRRPIEFEFQEEEQRLFGTVLPRHESLRTISLSRCVVPFRYLRAMVMAATPSSSSSSITQVSLYDCTLDPRCEAVRAMVDALGYSNGTLTNVRLSRCGLDAGQCRAVFDGAANSRSLVSLSIDEPDKLVVDATALSRALGSKRSSLRTLRVAAKEWNPDGISSVARLLRTNETVEAFDASGANASALHDELRRVLETYNASLRYLSGVGPEHRAQMNRLLDRNVQVRRDYDRLQDEGGVPRVGQSPPLYAEALGRVRRFPTLLYRVLRRHGIAVAVAEHCLLQDPNHIRQRKRKRGFTCTKADADGEPARLRRYAPLDTNLAAENYHIDS